MDIGPSVDKLWLFEWDKQRGILAPNKNARLQNRSILLGRFELIKQSKFSNSHDLSIEGPINPYDCWNFLKYRLLRIISHKSITIS